MVDVEVSGVSRSGFGARDEMGLLRLPIHHVDDRVVSTRGLG